MRHNTFVQVERRKLQAVGKIIMNDMNYTVEERIQNWRAYLKEYEWEKEQLLMRIFKEQNGFDADDDDAKRTLIDSLYYDMYQYYPQNDDERNQYVQSSQVNRLILQIGWKPKHSIHV